MTNVWTRLSENFLQTTNKFIVAIIMISGFDMVKTLNRNGENNVFSPFSKMFSKGFIFRGC